ncbi:NUDIX hydrolase [Candidatus Poribacteria bacterium]|nr:NUDIX domain-containing protein [Candidatus Poribacteria bacterium]MXY28417.1 NUDIX hydrolase [Candidatus Poribacteria bacterium]MYK19562.1 NUDIX hydrolase [Candidatus Poribacteria bacterium]
MSRAQCLVHKQKRILMVKHRHKGEEWWCLPGGGIEEDETPEQAALRELREECRVEGTIIRPISVITFAPGDQYYTYLIEIGAQAVSLGNDPELKDDQILVDVAWMSLNELTERDRVFLWTAGLLTIPEFSEEIWHLSNAPP